MALCGVLGILCPTSASPNPSPSNTPPSHSPTNTPTTPVNNPPPATTPNNPGTTPQPQPPPSSNSNGNGNSNSNTGTNGASSASIPNAPSVISISGSAVTTISGSSGLPLSMKSGMMTSTLPLLSASSRPTSINGGNSTSMSHNGTIATTNGTSQNSSSSDTSHSGVGIAVGVSVAAAIIIALVVFFVIRKRRNASAALDDDGDFRSFDAVFDEKEASVQAREIGEIGIDKEVTVPPKAKFIIPLPNIIPASRSLSTMKPRLSAIPPPPSMVPWIETTTVPSEGLGRYPTHVNTTPPEEVANPFVPIPPPARKRNSTHSNILNAMTQPRDSIISEKSEKSEVRASVTSTVLSEPLSMLSESALQGVEFPDPPPSDASSVYSTSTYNHSVYQHSRHPSNSDSISDNPFFDRDELASPGAPAVPAVPAIPTSLVRKASRPPTADHPTIQEISESVRDSSESRRSIVDPKLQLALQERHRRSEIVSAYLEDDDEDFQDSPVSAEFFDAPSE